MLQLYFPSVLLNQFKHARGTHRKLGKAVQSHEMTSKT